jgi:hypothetical protein
MFIMPLRSLEFYFSLFSLILCGSKTYSLRIQRMKNNAEKPQKHLQNKEKRQMNTNPRPSKPIGVIRVNSRNSWTKPPCHPGPDPGSRNFWIKQRNRDENIFTTDSTDEKQRREAPKTPPE